MWIIQILTRNHYRSISTKFHQYGVPEPNDTSQAARQILRWLQATVVVDAIQKMTKSKRIDQLLGDCLLVLFQLFNQWGPSSVVFSHKLSAVESLKNIQVSHVLWWVFRNPDFLVIENYPFPIFVDVSNIVTTLGRGTNVAHYSHKPVSCGMTQKKGGKQIYN